MSDPLDSHTSSRRSNWRSLFHQSPEPIFLLDSRSRLIYANPAWEMLTAVLFQDLRTRVCRPRSRPKAGTVEPLLVTLAPPFEVFSGQTRTVRRTAPGSRTQWDLSFLPIQAEDGSRYVLGKIHSLGDRMEEDLPPIPTNLDALRSRASAWHRLELLESLVPAMHQTLSQVELCLQTRVPVWIQGEVGVGKQTLARVIHNCTPHEAGPFISIDCERIPSELIDELLFGTQGLGTKTKGGTLYLREIAFLPRELQQQFVETVNDFRHSLSHTPRIIIGTRQAPQEAVATGQLLETLRVSLAVVSIEIPPLRDRVLDIGPITECLLSRIFQAKQIRATAVSAPALAVLQKFPWPGNLRELFQVLRAAAQRCPVDEIRPEHLPFYVRDQPIVEEVALSLDETLERVERRLMELALAKTNGNKSKAAEALGIARARLIRKLAPRNNDANNSTT